MTDDDRQQQEAVAQFAAGYQKLVELAARAASEGRKAQEVRDVVDDMPESMAKGMLITRIGADVVRLHEDAQSQATDAAASLN